MSDKSEFEEMQKILRGSDCVPFHKEFERYFAKHIDDEGNEKISLDLKALRKAGVSVKDLIAPQVIAKTRQCIQLDDERYCKSYAYANLPQQLDTSFLTNVTSVCNEKQKSRRWKQASAQNRSRH